MASSRAMTRSRIPQDLVPGLLPDRHRVVDDSLAPVRFGGCAGDVSREGRGLGTGCGLRDQGVELVGTKDDVHAVRWKGGRRARGEGIEATDLVPNLGDGSRRGRGTVPRLEQRGGLGDVGVDPRQHGQEFVVEGHVGPGGDRFRLRERPGRWTRWWRWGRWLLVGATFENRRELLPHRLSQEFFVGGGDRCGDDGHGSGVEPEQEDHRAVRDLPSGTPCVELGRRPGHATREEQAAEALPVVLAANEGALAPHANVGEPDLERLDALDLALVRERGGRGDHHRGEHHEVVEHGASASSRSRSHAIAQ